MNNLLNIHVLTIGALRGLLGNGGQGVAQGGVHVIDVPIDVQQNMALMKEMKSIDCAQFSRE